MKILPRVLVLALLLSAFLAACGSDETDRAIDTTSNNANNANDNPCGKSDPPCPAGQACVFQSESVADGAPNVISQTCRSVPPASDCGAFENECACFMASVKDLGCDNGDGEVCEFGDTGEVVAATCFVNPE